MMTKKVKLELTVSDATALNGALYLVKKVTNSVEWTPGDVLTPYLVKGICSRRDPDVVISQKA